MPRRKVKREIGIKVRIKALGHKISILQKRTSLARAVNKVIQN